MNKAASFIVKYRVIFAIIFLALIVFSVFSVSWVSVENDITVYLPDSAEAKAGLTIMGQEFKTYATADIMVENVTLEQAQALEESITSTEGVSMVTFDTTEEHYKDNCALYSITFNGTADDETAIQGLANVKALLADQVYYVKSDSFSNIATILVQEMSIILVIVVIVVIVVLLFTSSSYAEPLVMLGTFLAAAIINMGTNFILGTISFVSNSVAIVLQLALSVDYAIIYSNRYKEEHETLPVKEAAVKALAASIPEISASSLTTMAGLLAMCFMQFRLGLDMGVALIKAILLSLLSVFLFMPFLVVALGPLMDKTKHKNFVPKISFLGRFAYKTRFIFPVLFVALVIFAYVSFGHVNYAYYTGLVTNAHQNEEDIATAKIENEFGKNNLVAVIYPSGDLEKEAQLAQDFAACDEVKSVLSLSTVKVADGIALGSSITWKDFADLAGVDETTAKALFAYYAAGQNDTAAVRKDMDSYSVPVIDLFLSLHELAESGEVELEQDQMDLINSLYDQLQMAEDQLEGENYSRMLVYINLPEQSSQTFEFLGTMHVLAAKYYPENVYLTGNSVSAQGFADTFQEDINIVGLMSVGLVMLILLLTFKSIGMPLLLILVIQGSIWINFATAVWTHKYVFFMCYLIVSAIQMGANIDYAIVISSRYNELRAAGQPQREAIIDTLNFAFPTVITSGSMMVVAGLMIGQKVSQCVIAGMGQYVGTGTIITLLLVNLVLPQLLVLGDTFVRVTTLHVHPTVGLRKTGRAVAAVLLVGAIVFAFSLPPILLSSIRRQTADTVSTAREMQQVSQELSEIAARVETTDSSALQYQFAESLLTDEIGSEQLEEGQEQYDEGKEAIDSAKEELADGEKQYQEGLAQYNAGAAQLSEGQATYDDANAQLQAAKAEYAEGEKQLADAREQVAAGQAVLDAAKADYAAGEEQMAAAKQTYAEGEAKLNAVTPIYNAIMSAYGEYQNVQAQYDQAVADGDEARAMLLSFELEAARAAYESQIGSTGYSMESIVSEYEAGQAELAEGAAQIEAGQAQLDAAAEEIAAGEQQLEDAQAQIDAGQAKLDAAAAQIADAERQLAAGKEELDAGYAQLDNAGAQLADARTQLDDGYDQVDEGQEELDAAGKQLEEGKKTLAENKEKLNDSIAELDSLSDDNEKLQSGTALLQSFSGVNELAGSHAGYAEICAAGEQYFSNLISSIQQESTHARLLIWVLAGLALIGLGSLLLYLLRFDSVARWLAFICGVGALVCAMLWKRSGSFGVLPFIAALVLAVTALVFAFVLLALSKRVDQVQNA